MWTRSTSTLLLLAISSAPLAAQMKLLDVPTATFAPAFSAVGDVNGDGRDDFAVRSQGGALVPGAVELRSGAGGTVLWQAFGVETGDQFGSALAPAGDVNLDGVPDLLAGAPAADAAGTNIGYVRLLSGADGSTLLHLGGSVAGAGFGAAVCGIGDANGDGVPDFAVATNAFAATPGTVTLRSGATGAVLQSWSGSAGAGFGQSIAGPGDINGDGVPDVALVVGNDVLDTRVYSGATGAELLAQTHGAGQVAAAGDLDLDGTPDLLVLANFFADGTGRVVSGATGQTLLDFGHGGDFSVGPWGQSLDVLGDVTGDGKPDYVLGDVGGITELKGRAHAFSGADGAELYTVNEFTDLDIAPNPFGEPTFAALVANLGDVNGDGAPDFGASGPQHVVVFSAPVNAFSVVFDGWVTPFTPDLFCNGTLQPGSAMSLRVEPLAAGRPVYLLAGSAFSGQPFKGGTLIPVPQLVAGPFLPDGGGKLVLVAHWPAGVPPGTQLYLQAWQLALSAPQGLLSTNGALGTTRD